MLKKNSKTAKFKIYSATASPRFRNEICQGFQGNGVDRQRRYKKVYTSVPKSSNSEIFQNFNHAFHFIEWVCAPYFFSINKNLERRPTLHQIYHSVSQHFNVFRKQLKSVKSCPKSNIVLKRRGQNEAFQVQFQYKKHSSQLIF